MGNRITVFLTEFLRNMASGGVPMIISGDEDSEDGDIDSQKDSTKRKNDANPANSKQDKIWSFEGMEAQQLTQFFDGELNNEKVKISISEVKGKKNVELSSSNPTLLATEKQRLERLLQNIECKEIDNPTRKFQEVDNVVTSNHLNLVTDLKNGKLNVYYRDESEFDRLERLLKSSNSNRRRDRSFANSVSGTSNSEPTDKDTAVYNGASNWQSTDASYSAKPNVGKNVIPTYLGDNVQVKLEINPLNGINTKIYQGSITRARVDAIVNAANERLDNCGGVAEVISKAAGHEMENECRQKLTVWSKIKVSENIVTRAGKLPCSWIIHAVGPRWSSYDDKEKALEDLYRTVVNILNTACERQFVSVVMPPISSGIFGVPIQACAAMYVRALLDFSEKRQKSSLREFHIIDMKSDVLDLICKEYEESKKHGRERLIPRNVIERLGIRSNSVLTSQNVSRINYASYKKEGPSSSSRISTHFPKVRETGQGKFTVEEKLDVFIYTDNIIDLKNLSILVCAEGRETKPSGRIAKMVMEKASKQQQKTLQKLLFRSKQCSNVMQTDFGINNYKMIFFAIIRRFGENKPRQEDFSLLENTTVNVLEAANKSRKKGQPDLSVAMPLLGTGSTFNAEYLQQYADVVCDCILNFAKEIKENTRLKAIHLVNFNQPQTNALTTAFKKQCLLPKEGPIVVKNSHSHSFQRSQFDHNKYKKVEVWETVGKSHFDFESCIENATGNDESEPVKSDESRRTGNILFIDSEDEEIGHSKVDTLSNTGTAGEKTNNNEAESEPSTCIVCMEDKMEDPVILTVCRHKFCRSCIEECFSHKPVCPVCNTFCGEVFGNQPKGTATIYLDTNSLPGYDCQTYIIHYEIPDGKQTDDHPHPGVQYTGLSRQAYLPDNPDGRTVLGLLKKAFEHRLIFTVGVSRTSGKDDVVTWNDVHHKTRREGGPEKFGYPDPEYLERVKEELAAKGITY